MRRVSSALVYHELIKNTAPGKNGASTKPRKNRITIKWVKLSEAALHVDTTPQRQQEALRYSDGRSFVRMRLEGSCMSKYPTKKIDVARLKSVPDMPRSSSREPCLACARFERS